MRRALVALAVVAVMSCGSATGSDPAIRSVASPTDISAQLRSTTPPPTSSTNTRAPTPIVSPTITSTARVTPTPTPAAPSPTVSVVFVSVRSPVSRGGVGQVTVSTKPLAACTIVVTYKSGPSGAQGHGPKTADGSGNVGWSWNIGTNTTPGSWPIAVTCDGVTSRASFVVQ